MNFQKIIDELDQASAEMQLMSVDASKHEAERIVAGTIGGVAAILSRALKAGLEEEEPENDVGKTIILKKSVVTGSGKRLPAGTEAVITVDQESMLIAVHDDIHFGVMRHDVSLKEAA